MNKALKALIGTVVGLFLLAVVLGLILLVMHMSSSTPQPTTTQPTTTQPTTTQPTQPTPTPPANTNMQQFNTLQWEINPPYISYNNSPITSANRAFFNINIPLQSNFNYLYISIILAPTSAPPASGIQMYLPMMIEIPTSNQVSTDSQWIGGTSNRNGATIITPGVRTQIPFYSGCGFGAVLGNGQIIRHGLNEVYLFPPPLTNNAIVSTNTKSITILKSINVLTQYYDITLPTPNTDGTFPSSASVSIKNFAQSS